MNRRMYRFVASALAVGLLGLTGCSSAGEGTAETSTSEENVELSVGITPIANAASLYVALDQGIFEDEGLTVTPEVIQNASTAVPSLLNDELQVALMTSVPAVTAASKGVPIEIVSGNDRYPEDPSGDTTALVAASGSGVETAGDLGGKTVAVVGLKSAPELALRIVLRDSGVDPDDVEVVEIAYPDMVSALQSGRVDAAFVVDPFLNAAEAAGLPVIGHPFTEGLGGRTALVWMASKQFAQENQDAIEHFARAMQRAGEYSNDHPEDVLDQLSEFTSLSDEAIKGSVAPTYDTEISDEDVESYAQLLVGEGFIKEEFDTSGLLAPRR